MKLEEYLAKIALEDAKFWIERNNKRIWYCDYKIDLLDERISGERERQEELKKRRKNL